MFEPDPIKTPDKVKVNKNKKETDNDNFEIDSDSKADWALQKIKEKKDKIEDKKEMADERKEMIDDWLDDETDKLYNQINNLEIMVKEYATKLKKKDKNFKTKKLPFGKIQYRKQRPKWKYDEEILLKSAKVNIPEAVKTKEKVYKSELKKEIKNGPFEITNTGEVVNIETGELLEGVYVEERGEKLSIKVKEDK
ncbi:MAG: host-nuclease inhibitor Gam family protein [Bacillota bacterium]